MLAFLSVVISHAKGTRYKTSCFRTADGLVGGTFYNYHYIRCVDLIWPIRAILIVDIKITPAQGVRVYQVVCSHWYVTF